MAKRAAPDEQPYRPLLDASLVSAALSNTAPSTLPPASNPVQVTPPQSSKIVEMPRGEPSRRIEQVRAQTENKPLEREVEKPTAPQLFEKFDQEKRILFTRGETQAIDRLVTSLAGRFNAQVKVSHVMRALVGLLLHAEGEIDKRAGELGSLTRPPNGDAQALQRFEQEIGKVIASGLRDAGPLR